MTTSISSTPATTDEVERVALAICEASGEQWKEGTYEVVSGPNFEIKDHPLDPFNNHWRFKAKAAIAAMSLSPVNGDQTAWLVEFPPGDRGPTYYGGGRADPLLLKARTTDPNAAMHFSRRQDAEAMVLVLNEALGPVNAIATEHCWPAAPVNGEVERLTDDLADRVSDDDCAICGKSKSQHHTGSGYGVSVCQIYPCFVSKRTMFQRLGDAALSSLEIQTEGSAK